MEGEIELALLYGERSEILGPPGARLDLLVVSPDLKRKAMERVLEAAGGRIGRDIRLTLLRPDRYHGLLAARDERLLAAVGKGHRVLIGDGSAVAPLH